MKKKLFVRDQNNKTKSGNSFFREVNLFISVSVKKFLFIHSTSTKQKPASSFYLFLKK
jgi:hypothetical protein